MPPGVQQSIRLTPVQPGEAVSSNLTVAAAFLQYFLTALAAFAPPDGHPVPLKGVPLAGTVPQYSGGGRGTGIYAGEVLGVSV